MPQLLRTHVIPLVVIVRGRQPMDLHDHEALGTLVLLRDGALTSTESPRWRVTRLAEFLLTERLSKRR